ncbi:DENN domain-containing protein 5B-like isoform X2 [Dendronephthya gigantea]|uniref:DENN domain-containing protein 5B-like isoform X2 n=1 Tax=Dendronephthya gigantea TaxID=151771 RepID=UPI00106C17A0|nr:DENN domain-containing protein 5B-like isoform X2 [Dendronephthya gigantea]
MSAQTGGQRLIDYFVVCGLDNVSGLEPDQLLGDSLHVAPVERSYKAKTLAHYPESVSWNPFDEHAVCMLSLPNGLQFKLNTETHSPSFHSFLITREDGSRLHGFALTFYEKVKDYGICQAMQILQDMFMAELALSSTKTRSHSAIPYRDHLEGFETYLHNKSPSPTPEIKLYNSEKHNLLVSKCLCLVMPLPFISAAKACLNKIYQAGLHEEDLNFPLECYLYNLIYEVPLPPPGRNLKFTCIMEEVMCQRPGPNELPLFDYSMEDLLEIVGIKDFLKLVSCVMLEHQILIIGSDFYTFMLVAETITSVIFPYTWQHVYVPILPASLLHFLEAPVPFVMGLYCNDTNDTDALLPAKSSLCCLDLNNRVLTVPDELPELPHEKELSQELSEVLAKYSKKANGSPNTGRSSPSQIPKKKNSDARLIARKPKKVDVIKAGLTHLKTSRSASNLTPGEGINPRLASLEKVAQKTGIQINLPLDGKEKPSVDVELDTNDASEGVQGLNAKKMRELEFNLEIREILLNWFTQLFYDYASFVIYPQNDEDIEQWLQNREQMENFDKAAFLSDQPPQFLPFLAPFIETQMFATFIDNKLFDSDHDTRLAVFDQRIEQINNRLGNDVRSHSYERCQSVRTALQVLSKRTNSIDHTAPVPHVLDVEIRRGMGDGIFPDLIEEAFVLDNVDYGRRQPKVNWRRRDRQKQHSEHISLNAAIKQDGKKIRDKLAVSLKRYLQENKSTRSAKSQLGDMSLNSSDAHISFIQQLLTECKAKTKRMLVLKMGQEAKDLGHNDVKGVEENTLIASLCDLLDRIWGHGLNIRKAKSPLWFHLLSYYESCDGDAMELSEDSFSSMSFPRSAESSPVLPRKQHMRRSTSPEPSRVRTESPAGRRVTMASKTLGTDVRSVRNLSEIKTDTGCLRAFVRLALEKKTLSKHLKTLLNDKDILRQYYKNYAFVRTEEEREQFLYYLLSLNAVDYFCFTNCFTTLAITYKVVIVTGKQLGGSTTTANVWMILAGEIKDTNIIDVPKGECEFRFQHPNVGKLTTLRIGHDSSGYAPGWFVEQVLVRNEITGHLYRFPCGRWLAKSNDDGSTERLLVAELQQKQNNNNEECGGSNSNSPQRRSPVVARKTPERNSIPVVQENVANAVNNIVKYFCRQEPGERGYLTYLLCGENGLCDSLDQVFQCGFKSSRLFQKNFFIWDFIEKVYMYLNSEEGSFILTEQRHAKLSFCSVVQKINDASQTVGKDGKFQTLICLGARDHLLEEWFPLISVCPVTTHMYEQNSFLRDKDMIQFLVDVLRSLVEFNIVLESSLLKGIS